MEEHKRLTAALALGLATMLAMVSAPGDTAPFPIDPGTAVQMVHQITPFDSGDRTVTDAGAIRAVIDGLNATDRAGAGRRIRPCGSGI